MDRGFDPRELHNFNYEIRDYTCGHCGRAVSGFIVARHLRLPIEWLSCPSCKKGSVLNAGTVHPQPLQGENIVGLPEAIRAVYDEVRRSFSTGSYTACELVCRKILMNVAVEKGADEGREFTYYIDFLENSGFITPNMKDWVNIIRQNGNDAAHKIETPDRDRAENTMMFTTQLLKLVYETGHFASKFSQ